MAKIFYLLVLSVFITIYKRLVIPSSFVSGTANVYLTPKIYLTDPLLIYLFFLEIGYFFRSEPGGGRIKKILREHLVLVFFLFTLLISVALSGFPLFSLYSFLRLVSCLPLFFFILSPKFNYQKTVRLLALPVLLVSLLSLFQWRQQHSLFGFFPFGEASFSSSSANAPLVNYLGSLWLRASGTFPHPNILGGFLALSLTLILELVRTVQTRIERSWLLVVFLLGLSALYFSFSQAAWGAFILGLGVLVVWSAGRNKTRVKKVFLILLVATALGLLFRVVHLLPLDASGTRRGDLLRESSRLFFKRPLAGVGLGNFVRFSRYYWKEPVHNIYLLLLSETGVFGLAGFLLFLISRFNQSVKVYSHFPFALILLAQLLFLGLFDHYFITSATGAFFFWFVLGLASFSPRPRH